MRGKIRDINMIFSRLGNIVTNTDRRKIKEELHTTEKKEKAFQIMKKKTLMFILSN